jgi:hypothetical protein
MKVGILVFFAMVSNIVLANEVTSLNVAMSVVECQGHDCWIAQNINKTVQVTLAPKVGVYELPISQDGTDFDLSIYVSRDDKTSQYTVQPMLFSNSKSIVNGSLTAKTMSDLNVASWTGTVVTSANGHELQTNVTVCATTIKNCDLLH